VKIGVRRDRGVGERIGVVLLNREKLKTRTCGCWQRGGLVGGGGFEKRVQVDQAMGGGEKGRIGVMGPLWSGPGIRQGGVNQRKTTMRCCGVRFSDRPI